MSGALYVAGNFYLIFSGSSAADDVFIHTFKNFFNRQRLAAGQLFKVICKYSPLILPDSPTEGDHAVRAKREVGRRLCPHVICRARHTDRIEKGVLFCVIDLYILDPVRLFLPTKALTRGGIDSHLDLILQKIDDSADSLL